MSDPHNRAVTVTILRNTVAVLRARFNRPPLLPCSPVVYIDHLGRRWRVRDVRAHSPTPPDEDGKPTCVPVAITHLEPDGW